jgi:hypothetical protein
MARASEQKLPQAQDRRTASACQNNCDDWRLEPACPQAGERLGPIACDSVDGSLNRRSLGRLIGGRLPALQPLDRPIFRLRDRAGAVDQFW